MDGRDKPGHDNGGLVSATSKACLGDVRTARLDVHGIERLAGRHEQPVALGAAETHVGADLRQSDLADADAIRGEYVHPVVAVADPPHAGPHVAVLIATDAID